MERKFDLFAKVKGRILGICLLHDKFIIVELYTKYFRYLWLNLYSVVTSGSFDDSRDQYVVKLRDIFYFRGQVFIFRSFLNLNTGKAKVRG